MEVGLEAGNGLGVDVSSQLWISALPSDYRTNSQTTIVRRSKGYISIGQSKKIGFMVVCGESSLNLSQRG